MCIVSCCLEKLGTGLVTIVAEASHEKSVTNWTILTLLVIFHIHLAHLKGLGASEKRVKAMELEQSATIFVFCNFECSVGKYLCDSRNAAELMSQYASRPG